jgi:hypothetical protein
MFSQCGFSVQLVLECHCHLRVTLEQWQCGVNLISKFLLHFHLQKLPPLRHKSGVRHDDSPQSGRPKGCCSLDNFVPRQSVSEPLWGHCHNLPELIEWLGNLSPMHHAIYNGSFPGLCICFRRTPRQQIQQKTGHNVDMF